MFHSHWLLTIRRVFLADKQFSWYLCFKMRSSFSKKINPMLIFPNEFSELQHSHQWAISVYVLFFFLLARLQSNRTNWTPSWWVHCSLESSERFLLQKVRFLGLSSIVMVKRQPSVIEISVILKLWAFVSTLKIIMIVLQLNVHSILTRKYG